MLELSSFPLIAKRCSPLDITNFNGKPLWLRGASVTEMPRSLVLGKPNGAFAFWQKQWWKQIQSCDLYLSFLHCYNMCFVISLYFEEDLLVSFFNGRITNTTFISVSDFSVLCRVNFSGLYHIRPQVPLLSKLVPPFSLVENVQDLWVTYFLNISKK